MDFDYTEYVSNKLLGLASDDISTFSIKDYINFANEFSDFVSFIKNSDLVKNNK